MKQTGNHLLRERKILCDRLKRGIYLSKEFVIKETERNGVDRLKHIGPVGNFERIAKGM